MDKRIMSYYKKRFYGGRSFPVRIADTVFFCLIIYACLYFMYAGFGYFAHISLFLATLTMIAVVITWQLLRTRRFNMFLQSERERITKAAIAKELCYTPQDEFERIAYSLCNSKGIECASCHIAIFLGVDELCGNTLLSIFNDAISNGLNKICIVTSAKLSESAVNFIDGATQVEFTILDSDAVSDFIIHKNNIDICAYADALVCKELQLAKDKHKSRFSSAFSLDSTRRYIALGMLLFVFSFFVRYALYYRLIASICISVGAYFRLLKAEHRH